MATIARTSPTTRLLAAAAAGLCAIAASLSGCAGSVQQRVGMPPSDAMLSVTVMPQRPRFQRPEREFAPARYVVEADGMLRAAVGEGVTVETYPGRTRDLSPDEWANLWKVALETGVLDPDDPRTVSGEMSLTPDPLRRATIWLRGGGRSAGMVVDPSRDEPTARLVTLLEELAWIRTPWETTDAPKQDPAPWDVDDPDEFPVPPPSPSRRGDIPPNSPDPFGPGR